MRRPSVLFLNRVYPPGRGATGRVLRDLARSFAREGWQVTVITTGPKAGTERDGAVRIIRVKGPQKPGTAGYLALWAKILFTALKLPRTDLLVSMTDPPLLAAAGDLIKRVKKNRHVHWCQDLYPDILPALGTNLPEFAQGFFKRVAYGAMGRADKVIVIGRCMARHLTYNGLDPKQITVIPNWPDFELIRPPGKNGFNGAVTGQPVVDGSRAFDDQMKDGPKFRVLYAGNIGRAHPIDTILGAAEILNEEHPEIEFLFVGDGPRYDEIARRRDHLHLGNIRLLPFQPLGRLKPLMESGDVHLISMKEEAAGLLVPSKLYAALAVHRPCILIGPEHSETAKVLHDFGAGQVVAQGHPRELADKIKEYRLNSDRWFAAHDGASHAGSIFVPRESINAWIERAWGVVEQDVRHTVL
ncbi:MAG: glycosyltransferase family 4 protein [Alphaproteobacteria bacterium]|nr:glycosyltransferase family 4 protein [Alphaproteobacteria bacterium]